MSRDYHAKRLAQSEGISYTEALRRVRAETSRYPTDPDLADLLAARRHVPQLDEEEDADAG